jgi:hypothetical protein
MVFALLQVLRVEEGTLPFLARLLSFYVGKVRSLARVEGGGAAYHQNGLRRLGLEVDQPAE